MADPEEIHKEVLAEEQAKGTSSVVAEARAKAARQRALHGSPHPKEPKWWPGAQPQFEGGDGAAEGGGEEDPAEEEAPAAEAETPDEEAPAEAPAAAEAPEEEAPAAEAPAAGAAPAPQETVAEPPELTRDQPEAPSQPAQPAAATAPVPAGAAATATLPSGATHGTASGNRLRPEDAVSTDAQFDAQAALLQRRKMIDELVSTGVPAVAVSSSERSGSGAGMLLLYLLIPLVAVFFLVNNKEELAGGAETAAPAEESAGGGLTISAANVQFDKDTLTIPVDGAPLEFKNEDSVEHNVAIYEDDSASKPIFKGQVIPGGQSPTYEIPAHEKGEYYFQCDVHPAMNGTATFE